MRGPLTILALGPLTKTRTSPETGKLGALQDELRRSSLFVAIDLTLAYALDDKQSP